MIYIVDVCYKSVFPSAPMVTPTPRETLDELFPIPSAPTVADAFRPAYHPGHSADSAKSLVKLLKENHERFHIFFNNRGFHK